MDNQKIIDGHTIPCGIKELLLEQILEPGLGPRTPNTLTEKEEKQANEDGTNPNDPPPCTSGFGGDCAEVSQEQVDQ
jgi:hypothetical protein